MTARRQLEADVRALLRWFSAGDRGLWPDEEAQLAHVREHLDGADTRPPERLSAAPTALRLEGRPPAWSSSRGGWGGRGAPRLRPSGAQLVSYAGLLMGYIRNFAVRNGLDPDGAPGELAELIPRLREDVKLAKAILSLGGELS